MPDAAQQPSKPHIGLGEKGFQTPHDEGQILWTEGDMELWLKLYQLLFCISLGQKDFGQVGEIYGGCNINCFQFVFLLFEASGLPYLLEEL